MSEASSVPTKRCDRTLAGRLTTHVVVSVAAVIALTTALGLALLVRDARRDWERRTAEFAQDLAATLAESTARADHRAVAIACGAFALSDVASHLRVTDAGGAPLYEFGERSARLIEASAPIQLRGAFVGRVELGVPPSVYLGPVVTSLELNVATAVTVLAALLAAGLLIRRRLRDPLDRLVSLLDRLSLGSYPEEPLPGEYSEFRAIVRSFGRMASRVRLGEASLVEANRRLVAEVERREQVAGALRESEERTRLILEAVPLPVILVDEALTIRQCNPAVGALAGARAPSLTGMVVGEAIHCLRRLDAPGGCGSGPFCGTCPLRAAAVATLEDGHPRRNVRVTLPYVGADGTTEVALLVSSAAVSLSGERLALLCLEDVTALVTAERSSRESAAALEAVFDATPIGVALVVDRTLRRVNDRFCTITGYAPGELIGRGIRALYPDDEEYRRVGKELYRTARERGIGTVESIWRRKDGTLIDVRLHGNALDPARPGDGFTFTVTDITEQRRVAQEREALQERLGRSQKLEAIGTLAGGIAHDFNNILGAIIGYTEFCLRHEDLRPELREDLEVVRQAGRRAADLVRQILAFSRQASQERVPVQPRHITAEALKLLRASFPSTIELRSRLDCDSVVLADPAQLHQILMNLCTNAALAMKERGGLLEVALAETRFDEAEARLEGVEPDRFVRLTVRDTGCGMSREVQERIFEPFFTTRPEGQGSGMGLSVVHGIVKSCGGFIAVRSAPGVGSVFDVYLPVANEESAAGAAEAEAPRGGDERVLLVDDEPLLVEVMQRGLSRGGYAVTPFLSSRDAARAFEETPDAWDVLVTDMTMPGVTGEELVRRARELRPDLPVILCTGYSEKMNAETAAALGIDRFALKPVTQADLRRLIREAIEERRGRATRLRAVGADG
jgi:PAS domain S-box-containing protein